MKKLSLVILNNTEITAPNANMLHAVMAINIFSITTCLLSDICWYCCGLPTLTIPFDVKTELFVGWSD